MTDPAATTTSPLVKRCCAMHVLWTSPDVPAPEELEPRIQALSEDEKTEAVQHWGGLVHKLCGEE